MSIFALSSTPALAAECKRVPIFATASAQAVFNKAGVRRAKRRAIRSWERKAKAKFGSRFNDIDNARGVRFFKCGVVKGTGRVSTFQSCSVRANACTS